MCDVKHKIRNYEVRDKVLDWCGPTLQLHSRSKQVDLNKVPALRLVWTIKLIFIKFSGDDSYLILKWVIRSSSMFMYSM